METLSNSRSIDLKHPKIFVSKKEFHDSLLKRLARNPYVAALFTGVVITGGGAGCVNVDTPAVKNNPQQTNSQTFSPNSCDPEKFVKANGYPTPVPIGGENSILPNGELNIPPYIFEIRDRLNTCLPLSDHQIIQVMAFNNDHPSTGIVVGQDQPEAVSTPSSDAQIALLNARATAMAKEYQNQITLEKQRALQEFANTLPRQIGIASWNGNWELSEGDTGFAQMNIYSSKKLEIINIKIPTITNTGKQSTIEQQIIIFKKETRGTMLAADYFFIKLYPLLPQVLPEAETITLIDGLGKLTLSKAEQAQIEDLTSGKDKSLGNYIEWDGTNPITEEMLDTINILSADGKINSGGIPFLGSEIKKLILTGILK